MVPVPTAGSRDARRESCTALFDPHFSNLSTEYLSHETPVKVSLHSTWLPCAPPLSSYPQQAPGMQQAPGHCGSARGVLPCPPGRERGGYGAWTDSRSLGGYPQGGTPGWEARALGHCAAHKALYTHHSFAMKTSRADGPHFTGKKHRVWTRHRGGSLDQLKAWNRKTQNSSV